MENLDDGLDNQFMTKYFDAAQMNEVTMERSLNSLYVKLQKVDKAPKPDKPKVSVYLQPLSQPKTSSNEPVTKQTIIKKIEDDSVSVSASGINNLRNP